MLELYNNKVAFLKEEPKMGFFIVILIGIALLYLYSFINKNEIYDHYLTKGIVSRRPSGS